LGIVVFYIVGVDLTGIIENAAKLEATYPHFLEAACWAKGGGRAWLLTARLPRYKSTALNAALSGFSV